MKSKFLVFLLVFINSLILFPNTGIATIENFQIIESVYSWELHFERTGEWSGGLLPNSFGDSDAIFNFNDLGLDNPSLQVEPGSPIDNANYNVVVEISPETKLLVITFNFATNTLAGTFPLNTKVKLLTVFMDIINPALFAGLSWNNGNTGFFDSQDQTIVTTLMGFNNSLLPIELNTFTAKTNNNSVDLKWQTATEINNHGFEVERKTGSLQKNINSWEKIGFVEGNGNSNSIKNYFFVDKNPSGGSKFIYRLKQVDNDGAFSYSDEIAVEIVPDKYELFQNYPNPFNPSTNIKFSLPKTSKVRLDIYNIIGQHIQTILNNELEAGFHNIIFNSTNLSSGTYIYRITTENFSQTKKMLLLK